MELRLPFVDYRLVETAIGLRKSSPDHMLPPKARFREVIKEYLPEWVLNRPKSGFTPPINEWIGTLNSRYNAELAKGYLVEHGVLSPTAAKWLAKPGSRVSAGPSTVYKSLVLEWWARGMSEASQFKPASHLLAAPRPRLTAILSKQERFVKPLAAVVPS